MTTRSPSPAPSPAPDAWDTKALSDLHAQCFTTPRPWSAPEIVQLLATPSVFLAGDDAGFVMGRVILDEAELLTLAIAPHHRRRGLGRDLLRRFSDESADRGATRGFLEVAADNAAALALYKAEGWAPIGRRKGYYRGPDGCGIDALVLGRGF